MSAFSFKDLVESRRSVRKYVQDEKFDHAVVKKALQLALLSPNSSNMQLWEFHRVISPELRDKMGEYCLGQKAATTASELVVFANTPGKWKEMVQTNAKQVRNAVKDPNTKHAQKLFNYYEKLMPIFYRNDVFGVLGLFRKAVSSIMGIKKPVVRAVMYKDVITTLNKNTSLAAMTFMLAMREQGYDTCAMEGFDARRIKMLLGLDPSDTICMVISCGIAAQDGVYAPRFRIDASKVIKEH